VVGLGTVTFASPVLSWVGHLIGLAGGKTGPTGNSSTGVIAALVLDGLAYSVMPLTTGQQYRAGQTTGVPASPTA
jgi:hypothetical protein